MTGGGLTVSNWGSEFIGNSGTGNFLQSGGSNTVTGELVLGNSPGSSGTYSLGGSGLLSASYEYVGCYGTGTFIQSGGTNTIANDEFQGLYLGYNAGSSGTYSLGGTAQLSAPSEYVGFDPAATALFQQTGGTNTVGCISVGSGGRYLLTGGVLQIGGAMINAGSSTAATAPVR